ncbi:MAG: hypothetical protein Q4A41_00310, partial [Bacillota bacterium]|nr:hypothetical protein [Bacillota bacterium]
MNKKRIIGILATLIVLAGMAVAIYPFAQDIYQQYRQRKLLEEYQNRAVIDVEVRSESADFLRQLTEASSRESDTSGSVVSSTETSSQSGTESGAASSTGISEGQPSNASATDVPASNVDELTDLTVIGSIQIPKIEVDMPIFKYSNQYQMDFGA